ncbi:hypothetical protein LPB41_21775 [Thalassospira sp. MA62]|nr:hypothetical protein [Thalassospira sp. MA62]
MNEQLQVLVEQTIAKGVGARVFPLRWNDRRVWVKQAVPAKAKVWHRLQRFLANVTRIPMLRPTVSPGGQAGLESEVAILRKLHDKGLVVPDVVAFADRWVAITDNGVILQSRIEDEVRAGNEDVVADLIKRAGMALANLHRAEVSHGAPLLRNLTLRDDGVIGFIDFEEDPNARMPIPDAQARDILLFVFSIQRGFKKRPDLLRTGWKSYVDTIESDAPQLRPLRRVIALLRPVYLILRPFSRKLGTDAINALLAYRTLRDSL